MTNEDAVIASLAADWRASGIRDGDMVLVHSSIVRTLRRLRKFGAPVEPGLVLRSFLAAVGHTGTLLFPLFNFAFTRGVPFDMRSSPSEMGILTECARSWPGSVRTGHPIYSFSAIGAKSFLFRDVCNFSGYASDSPFGTLHREGGAIAVLDLPDQDSMTYYHYVEEQHEVSYRYFKKFRGTYTDSAGNVGEKEFSLFVRNIEQSVVTRVDPMGEQLWDRGLYTGSRPNVDSGLRVIRAGAMFDEVSEVIRNGKARGLLYDVEH
jgi:aminoglycoside 3-N-acetyltransferase